MKHSICILIFPHLTALDFVGPYEVFAKAGCFDLYVTSAETGSVEAEGGLKLNAEYSFETCPACEILFIPGGRGVTPLLTDQSYLQFIKKQSAQANYITSVCTGSLLLATVGALDGYKATTHWRSLSLLKMFGIDVVEQRVVVDRNRITGAGVTSGVDFGLLLTAMIAGEITARTIQLMIEYDPQPPFKDGSTLTADNTILEKAIERSQELYDIRKHIVEKITRNRKIILA
jgi:cyclohexyl-isocyanide hydratase